jgi:hypothetical protein
MVMTKLPSLSEILARKEELDNLEKSKQAEKNQRRKDLEDRCKAALPKMLDLIQSNMDTLILHGGSIDVLFDPMTLEASICKDLLLEELRSQRIDYLEVEVRAFSDCYGLYISINSSIRDRLRLV